MRRAVAWYDKHADVVAEQYEAVDPESLHRWLADLLPEPPAIVLDVGAGTGRDSAWLAGKGYDVFAVEPSKAMRRLAKALHPSSSVRWFHDSLPSLEATFRTGVSFDAILASGVWMHLPRGQRPRAFRKLVNLLKPGGVIAISLRIGPADPERGMHPVDGAEIVSLARNHGTIVQREREGADQLGRDGIHWTNYALRLPDDGTGALPLLRHVILNDDKSSTYKLGLLRATCRIADGTAGLVRRSDDDTISVPLGMVALTWLRLFRPLIAESFPQSPTNDSEGQRLSFVRDGFMGITSLSNLDLRPGMRFAGAMSVALHHALRDAARTIRTMPARYMTFPDGTPILPVRSVARQPRAPARLVIDEAYLRSFGEMLVPWRVWQALQRFAVWIEPALVDEWIRLMRQYAEKQDRRLPPDRLAAAMNWSDPMRDVSLPKQRAIQVLESGKLYCVWSGKELSKGFLEMDHCFPWSAWPCSDLWNLMPTDPKVNRDEKRAKLPSARLMISSQDRIMTWWEAAYGSANPAIHERFVIEAGSSLPGVQPSERDLDAFFDGALAQRARLRHDQKIPEWAGEEYS